LSDHNPSSQHLDKAPLGKESIYPESYDASLLYPIPRSENRSKLVFGDRQFDFKGVDIWNAYEVSWLNAKGKPEVRLATFYIDSDSENIIESKSFKLYLNGFNQSRFDSEKAVLTQIQTDISQACNGKVKLFFEPVERLKSPISNENIVNGAEDTWLCLDELDIDITQYDRADDLLKNEDVERRVSEKLCSHLFKTNCPVTGQPDWASLYIFYKGQAISRQHLLRYLISFRQHQDFHEHCVEQIYVDLMNRCHPESLLVMARYTRRGGLDINPVRYTENAPVEFGDDFEDILEGEQIRLNRQ
jgi:7-cyano-7-deazaguanine reductase